MLFIEERGENVKLAVTGLVALGVLGTLPLIMLNEEGEAADPASIQQRKEAFLRYRLSVTGRDGSCTVAKGDALDAGRAELVLAADCISLMSRLSKARYWKEGADGQVIFAATDGSVIAEFYAADGVAYESLRPVSPLMALIAQ